MSMAARQGGKPRKTQDGNMGNNQGGNRNRGPWRNSGAPTNYSPSMNNNQRLPPQQQQQQQQQQQNGGPNQAGGHSHNFPPLSQNIQDKLAAMVPQIGATIIITSRTGQRHEGTVTTINPEGDPAAGFILKDVKDLGNPSGPLKETYFCPTTSIQSWIPAPSKPTDTFRTDTDISASAPKRERELQAWQPDAPAPPAAGANIKGDDATFGVNASGEGWDQFAANEALFGITAGFDEDQYTTKLDTSAPDFKEREKKAQQLANEILRSTTNNAHVAEERVMNNAGGNDTNEEDKYGAVVRNPNAYVPPGARKNGAPSNLTGKASPGPAATKPSPGAAAPIPKITTNGPDDKAAAAAPGPGTADNLVGTFRDFVTNEKQRLTQKKEAIVKHEMNKRMQDLVRFSKSFKLSQPIPEDLVPILTKDVSKQKAILEKSSKDAESTAARAIASQPGASSSRPSPQVSSPPANKITKPAVGTTSPAPVAGSSKIKQGLPAKSPINMVIQKIPPFDPAKRKAALAAAAANGGAAPSGAGAAGTPATSAANGAKPAPPAAAAAAAAQPAVPPSPAGSAKLNINAHSFKPNPNASSFKPGTSPAASSPKSKTSETAASPAPTAATPPNPFFGTRPIKKGPVHVKDDFNPFKFAKVAEASAVNATWPYSGKRFMQLFPVIQPMQHVPHPPMPVQPPQVAPPPAAYEEDSAQAAARGYGMVYYAPYPYPGQPPQMMAVPPGGAPPGAYIPSPYMQPMGYPHPMPPGAPPAMYHPPPPSMPGMPPPQAYPMPPGAYPPPNGQPPRGSMPPTPMPPHAYAYHPSPQLGHAVPYQVMMPPPGAPPPHGYEAVPQQGPPGSGPGGPPVPMGTH